MRIAWLVLVGCAPDRSRPERVAEEGEAAPPEIPASGELTTVPGVGLSREVDAWIYGQVDGATAEVPVLDRTTLVPDLGDGRSGLWVHVVRTQPSGVYWDWYLFDNPPQGETTLDAAQASVTGFLRVEGIGDTGAHEVIPAGDLDNDGEPDILVFHGDGVAIGAGPLEGVIRVALLPLALDLPTEPRAVDAVGQDRAALIDVDHDGQLELLVSRASEDGYELLGFTPPFTTVRTAADADFVWTFDLDLPPANTWLGLPSDVGDVTGDGVADWYVPLGYEINLTPSAGVVVDGSVAWAGAVNLADRSAGYLQQYGGVPAPVGDLNADGYDDVFVVDGTLGIFASGPYFASDTYATALYETRIASVDGLLGQPFAWPLGDIDGDGRDDVLTVGPAADMVAIAAPASGDDVTVTEATRWTYTGAMTTGARTGFIDVGDGVDVVTSVEGGLAIDYDASP